MSRSGNGETGKRGNGARTNTRRLSVSLFLRLTVLTFLATATPAQAQQVRATLSADSLSVGERAALTVVAEHDMMSEAFFPDADAGPAVFGDLTVIAQTSAGGTYAGQTRPGVKVDSVTYEVTTFALDTARVPPLPVRFAAGAADTVRARTAPLLVPVRRHVPPDAAGLRPVAPPADFPRPLWPYLLLALVAALLLAMGAYYLWQRYRQDEPDEPPAQPRRRPPVSPYEAAQTRLRHLEDETDLADPAALKAFYVELADTLRQYLAERARIRTRERTTRELLTDLDGRARRGRFPETAVPHLRAALTRADLAKFADARPTAGENRAALADARAALDAVEQSRRPPAPVPVAAG